MISQQWRLFFCKNVSYLRQFNSLSRTAMARIMGLTVKTLDRIKEGDIPQRTNIKALYNLHRYFGLSPQDLLSPPEKKKLS